MSARCRRLGRGDASDTVVCGGGEQVVATKKVAEV
jgi:hypothetical protein